MLVDTHGHIHEADYADPDGARERALVAGVTKMLCVGVNEKSSERAVELSKRYTECYAIVGVHPHDTKDGISQIESMLRDTSNRVVGVGEIGLDYFYAHSPRLVQIAALDLDTCAKAWYSK
ncbi:TatD family hydrolase [Candidatus Saccharibacteria bacterium]|nr:TatD family hydrolase [Candidatus Saccharibacteria bacterium]